MTYNLVNSFSLEEVNEPAHAVAQGLRSVSASSMLCGWFVDAPHSPYLLSDAEPSPFVIGEHLVASSSKIIAIDKVKSGLLFPPLFQLNGIY
jgi:hypothetical protein